MLVYSIFAMRDLIRNYKLIIKGKNQPDSDSELLVSSTSSPGFNSSMEVGQPRVFTHEHYTSESEDENPEKQRPSKTERKPFEARNSINMENNEYLYNVLHESNLNKTATETTRLLSSKRILDDSVVDFKDFIETTTPTNSSLVTIFAVWNTTVGTSLLAMAWGMQKAGLFPGIVINFIIAAVCLYTAYVLLKINEKHGIAGQNFEVPELCRLLIGRWAEIVSKIFSLIVLTGGDIVYWILMSNFIYNSVVFIYSYFNEVQQEEENVLCPKEAVYLNSTLLALDPKPIPSFYKVWDLYSTVPVILAAVMFPLLNIKSPTFFTKFNSFGTICIGYLIVFVAAKSFGWGVNMENWEVEFNIKSTFCVLSGMLTMSYFIHNIIISVMRHNRHQEHNGRDLTIAFVLVTFTYIFLGTAFFISFPLKKSCIEDNLLNNFSKKDTMALIARVLLFFQLFTVFPFVTYMLRTEILTCINMISGKERHGEFSYLKTILINSYIIFVCLMFACFMPRIGTLIRYTGALSGLIYIFIMPSLLKMASLRKEGTLTISSVIVHTVIIIMGILNLFSQFFITE